MSDKAEMLAAVPEFKCGQCGATGCRLYRPGGEFRREHRDRCNGCVTEEQRGWYVPLVVDSDGSAWGFSSIPDADCERFYALPENDTRSDAYTWARIGGWKRRPNDFVHSNPHRIGEESEKVEMTTSGEFNTPRQRDEFYGRY